MPVGYSKTKNILLIQVDAQLHSALGCMGNDLVATPHLDALSGKGTLFTKAYSCSGVCVPARASLMTGRYTIGHGVTNNHITLPKNEKTMGQFFADNGYVNGFFGKTHFGVPDDRDLCKNHGWDETFLNKNYNNYLRQEKIDAVYPEKNPVKRRTRYWGAGESRIPAEHYFENVIADRACDFMAKNAARNFLCYVSNIAPHGPFTPPEPYNSMYSPEDIKLAPRSAGELEGKPEQFRRWVVQNQEYLTEKELRIMMAVTYGLITLVDSNVGKLVTTLKENGLYDNTLIVFLSDHGDFNSKYGIIGKSWCMDDVLLRIPLIISHPQHREGLKKDALVQNVDILPTLLEFAGIPGEKKMHGKSMMPLLEGKSDSIREAVYAYDQARCSCQNLYKSMVRNCSWKYVYSGSFGSELYNLGQDPNEWENLSGREEVRNIELFLKDKLLEWHVGSSGLFYKPENAGFWEDQTCFYDASKFCGERIIR